MENKTLKKRFLYCLMSGLFAVVTVSGKSSPAAAGESPFDLIPDDAVIVIALKGIKSDTGLSYLLDLWKEDLRRRADHREKVTIRELYVKCDFSQAVGAMLIEKEALEYVIIVSLPDTEINFFTERLDKLLRREKALETAHYLNTRITYAVDREQEGLPAYTYIDNNLVLGSSVDVLKKLIRVKQGDDKPLTGSEMFNEIKAKMIGAWDGLLYIDNRDLKFAKILRQWEERVNLTLLMSAESLRGIGISFDIVSGDIIKGRILFLGRSGAILDDVQDDVRFFSAVIKRKLIPEDIVYTSDINVRDEYITLNFKASELGQFWTNLFEKKGIRITSFIASQQENFGSKSEDVPVGKVLLPRLIFILLLVVFVLIFGMVVRKRRKK